MKSLYEILYGAKVAKQGVVEEFTGDSLDERWSTNIDGSGSVAMYDAINGGALHTTGTTSGEDTMLQFSNTVRQYNFQNVILLGIYAPISSTNRFVSIGLNQNVQPVTSSESTIDILDNTAQDGTRLYTSSGTGESGTNAGDSSNTNARMVMFNLGVSSARVWRDGVFKIVKTTDLPTVKMQPVTRIRTLENASKQANFRYLEVFNY